LDNTDSDTDALAQGATVTDSFSYVVSDEHGATDTATLTITITGTNDAPVATADTGAVKEAGVQDGGNTAEPGIPAVSGNVLTNDTDLDTGHTLSVTPVSATGPYGSATIGSDAAYTYTLDNTDSDTDALAQGATVTDSFSYVVSDEHGATDTATLTI